MNQEDTIFYSDLVYHIRKLSKLSNEENPECEKRIAVREKDLEKTLENGETTYVLSNFTATLFAFIMIVSRKAERMVNGPDDLCNYQDLVKETIKEFYLKIAEDYSETPGGRYIAGGPSSGEDFRDNVLEPIYLSCIANNHKLVIDFDGGYGYSTGFLEETFGGLIRKGYHVDDILEHMLFVSNEEPNIITDIITYMKEEEQRLSKEEKQVKSYKPPKDLYSASNN